MNKKIILGLIGEMSAGKSTVTGYLKEKYGAVSFRFSDMLRDVLTRVHLETTRENMQTLSTILRKNFGEDLMSKVIAIDVGVANADFIITEGVRRPTDITYLRQVPGFHLVALSAAPRTRFERMTARRENPDDAIKTWEAFQAESQSEPEQKIKEIAAEAEFMVDNNGSLEFLHSQIDEIIKKLRG